MGLSKKMSMFLSTYSIGPIIRTIYDHTSKYMQDGLGDGLTKRVVAPDDIIDPTAILLGMYLLYKAGNTLIERAEKSKGRIRKKLMSKIGRGLIKYAPLITAVGSIAYEVAESLGILYTPISGFNPLGSIKDIYVRIYSTVIAYELYEDRYKDPLKNK